MKSVFVCFESQKPKINEFFSNASYIILFCYFCFCGSVCETKFNVHLITVKYNNFFTINCFLNDGAM